MTAEQVYQSSTTKRTRRTKAEMAELRDAIYQYARKNQVCSVRQIYYLGIGHHWDKDTGGNRHNYNNIVVRLAGQMREDEELPWGWISDNTRWVRRPEMHLTAEDALNDWIDHYRRDIWAYQPELVEVWCESDSIAGVIQQITMRFGVSLFVCRGQSGKSYVRDAALEHRQHGRPVRIIYAGDWDPTGIAIPNAVGDRIARYGEDQVNFTLERIGVTPEDVRSGKYISHGVNKRDPNYRKFKEACKAEDLDPELAIEVEALEPLDLRHRIQEAIVGYIDAEVWESTKAAEQSEMQHLERMATMLEVSR